MANKIIIKAQVPAPLNEWVGFVDDEGNQIEPEPGMMPNVLDWDITPEEAEGMMADDYLDEDQAVIEKQKQEPTLDQQLEEPWTPPDVDPDVPVEGNAEEALNWAVKNRRTLKIFYKTKGGSRSRGGRKLKREIGLPRGAVIQRIIEPHHMFQAKNGNKIVVTWDRSVGAIRAFIIANIITYSVLAKGKRNPFKAKPNVLPRSDRGTIAMENVQNQLKQVHSHLIEQKLTKTASVVKDALQAYKNFKLAQYVGIQGYWIRNRRCWDNCYRHKRTTNPTMAAQEVWMSCWDEYKKSINNDKSGWEKYAEKDNFQVRYGEDVKTEWDKKFFEEVEAKVASGLSRPEAIYAAIEEKSEKYADDLLTEASNLMEMASVLKESGYAEIAEKMAEASGELLKAADFTGNSKGWGPLGRGWDKIKNWWTGSGKEGDIKKKLQDLLTRANSLIAQLQRMMPTAAAKPGTPPLPVSPTMPAAASTKTIIIEAGKGTRITQNIKEAAKTKGTTNKRTNPVRTNRTPRKKTQPVQPLPPESVAEPTPQPIPAPINPADLVRSEPATGGTTPPSGEATATTTTNPPPTAETSTKGEGGTPATPPANTSSGNAALTNDYKTFAKDVSALMNEFSNVASRNDQKTAPLLRNVIPILQDFAGKSQGVFRGKDPRANGSAAVALLTDFSNNVRNALAGIGGEERLSPGEPATTVPAAGTPAAGTPAAGTPAQYTQPKGPDLMDEYLSKINDIGTLTNVRQKVEKRIDELYRSRAAQSDPKTIKKS